MATNPVPLYASALDWCIYLPKGADFWGSLGISILGGGPKFPGDGPMQCGNHQPEWQCFAPMAVSQHGGWTHNWRGNLWSQKHGSEKCHHQPVTQTCYRWSLYKFLLPQWDKAAVITAEFHLTNLFMVRKLALWAPFLPLSWLCILLQKLGAGILSNTTTCPGNWYRSAIPKHIHTIGNYIHFSKWLNSWSNSKKWKILPQNLNNTSCKLTLQHSLQGFWCSGCCEALVHSILPLYLWSLTCPRAWRNIFLLETWWKVQLENYCCYSLVSQAPCKIRGNRSITFTAKAGRVFPCI